MKKLITIMSLLSVFNSAKAVDYSEGQLWAYKTRAGEEKSTVLINKIETHQKLGKIFHISVDGVRVKNNHIQGGASSELPHFPVSEETLNKSLTKLLGKRKPNQNYIEGYNTWKSAFDAGKAGIFTISVSEIVGFIEDAINKQ
ncbi:hypothetical protein ACO0LL_07630 [Undibacterium sp. TC4M20W]|uniref:hypothetical protein n=1 Tax=unclassified Undibacterium TaxID=2630295 RepID=UPI003BF0BB1F